MKELMKTPMSKAGAILLLCSGLCNIGYATWSIIQEVKERKELKKWREERDKERENEYNNFKSEYNELYGDASVNIDTLARLVHTGEFRCSRDYEGNLFFAPKDGYSVLMYHKSIADEILGKDYGYKKTES